MRTSSLSRSGSLLVFVFVSAGLPAAAPAQEAAIEACVGMSGRTRIVDAAQACGAGERRVTWSVQGPPGPRGPAGAGSRGPCDDKIGLVTFAGLPGSGPDVPGDLGFVKLNVTRPDPAGGPRPTPMTVYRRADQTSPRLVMAAVLASPTSVRVELFRPSTQIPGVILEALSPSFVSAYKFASPNSDVLCEEIDVEFCEMDVTSIPETGPASTIRINRCAAGS